MIYEAPTLHLQGGLNPILEELIQETFHTVPPKDWRIKRLLHFIDSQNGRLGWRLDHLCQELSLAASGAHIAKLFKRETGIGIRDYVKQKRLGVAAERLKNTNLSLKEIAVDLGYRSPGDLQRQFKSVFHLNPIDFRTAYRQTTVEQRVAR